MSVTVCIITYNQSGLADRAIHSAIEQSKEPDKVIVADDGSNDGTKEVIRKIERKYPDKLKVLLSEKNRGIAKNLNSAIKKASTEYVTWMGGDDILYENKIEKEYNKLQSSSYDVVYSNFEYIDIDGEVEAKWSDFGEIPRGDVFKSICANDWPRGDQFRSPMLPLEVVRDLDYFDEKYTLYSDWEFKIRLSLRHKCSYIPQPLSAYRIHRNSINRQIEEKIFVNEIRTLLNEHEETIRENMKEKDYREVIRNIEKIISKHNAEWNNKNGNYRKAVYLYIKYLLRSKSEIKNYKQHAKFFLPNILYRRIKSVLSSGT